MLRRLVELATALRDRDLSWAAAARGLIIGRDVPVLDELLPLERIFAYFGADERAELRFSEETLHAEPAALLLFETTHPLWNRIDRRATIGELLASTNSLGSEVRVEVDGAWHQLVRERRWLSTFAIDRSPAHYTPLMHGFGAVMPPEFVRRPVPQVGGGGNKRLLAALGLPAGTGVEIGDLPNRSSALTDARGFGKGTLTNLVMALLSDAREWRYEHAEVEPVVPVAADPDAVAVFREGIDELAALFGDDPGGSEPGRRSG